MAGNSTKMSAFAMGWADEHDLSEPMTGAIFDILIDVFHDKLVRRGDQPRSRSAPGSAGASAGVGRCHPVVLRSRLCRESGAIQVGIARGTRLCRVAFAETLRRLSADYLNYDDVGVMLLEVDLEMTGGGGIQDDIVSNLQWREIGLVRVGPRVASPDEYSPRILGAHATPADQVGLPRMSYANAGVAPAVAWCRRRTPAGNSRLKVARSRDVG